MPIQWKGLKAGKRESADGRFTIMGKWDGDKLIYELRDKQGKVGVLTDTKLKDLKLRADVALEVEEHRGSSEPSNTRF
jgi:hypothetical protein